MFDDIMVIGMGNSKAIMKITAIRKNRDKNGSCADVLGQTHFQMGTIFLGLHYIF